ncbi:uncharacterized protein LODBEIA_P28270 [Lodderomyces beijingensis]|uniref:Uncharacterized protein n=1 Tax=Lodderomyces beijingensis TaxID=1775926 RepID=A0ABP0ZKC1_9ASCO
MKNTKTREEILADFENDLIRFEAMQIQIEGHDEPLVFSRDMFPMPNRLHFIVPEYSVYHLSIRYSVKTRPLRNLSYHQTVKKSGIIVDSRDLPMIQEAMHGQVFEHTFIAGGVPGGAFLRTEYPAKSTIRENGVKIWSYKWTLEISKKATKPTIGGFD